MKRLYVGALVAGLGLSPAAVAQTDAVILGTDQFGTSLRVAPGDIVTFNATGLTSSLSGTVGSVRATGTPLPATLAGISATMAQTRASSLAEKGPVPVPLLRVGKHKDYNSRCSIPEGLLVQPCPEVTNVTVQIPYAMAPDIPFTFNFPNTVQIVITDGTHNAATLVYPWLSHPRILTAYDAPAPNQIEGFDGQPLVMHADGRVVWPRNPALVGEELVMYATGLGLPVGGVAGNKLTTGDVTPIPAPRVGVSLSYDYRVNASPSQAQVTNPDPYLRFAGMTPGSVGLYQVNFVVPPPPAGLKECDDVSIASNLTVTLLGAASFDGAAICVKNPPAQ